MEVSFHLKKKIKEKEIFESDISCSKMKMRHLFEKMIFALSF